MLNKHWILLSLFVVLAILGSCSDLGSTPTAGSECASFLTTAAPRPSFLNHIYPTDVIKLGEYQELLNSPDVSSRGVQITVTASGLDTSVLQSIDRHRARNILERVTLTLNGSTISNDLGFISDGLTPGGPFWIAWPVVLNSGQHTALISFRTDIGRVITYSWDFCIVP